MCVVLGQYITIISGLIEHIRKIGSFLFKRRNDDDGGCDVGDDDDDGGGDHDDDDDDDDDDNKINTITFYT